MKKIQCIARRFVDGPLTIRKMVLCGRLCGPVVPVKKKCKSYNVE